MPLLTRIIRDHPDLPVLAADGIACGGALAAVLEDALRASLDDVLPDYQRALDAGDVRGTAVWAGESVDFVNAVRSAAEVIEEICRDAERSLNR